MGITAAHSPKQYVDTPSRNITSLEFSDHSNTFFSLLFPRYLSRSHPMAPLPYNTTP
jgi:hypothetical protein